MSRTVVTGGIWAENAPNVPISGEPTTGVTYANTEITEAEIQSGWPFKTVVNSADANEVLRRLTTLMDMLESLGFLEWSPLTDYIIGSFARGSDNKVYKALLASGPSTATVDPTSVNTSWVHFDSMFLGATATAANSLLLGGLSTGNAAGKIPLNNSTLNVGLNAQMLDGHASSYYQPVPVGSVFYMATSTPPDGYLVCDGSEKDREDYAALFAAVGTVFGIGNGVSTFNLPDLRGEFVRGWDTGGSLDPGREFGSDQVDRSLHVDGFQPLMHLEY